MGIPIPIFELKRPLGSIKEYLILLYFDLISSYYYKNGKNFLSSLYLWWYSGQLCYDKKIFYVPYFKKPENIIYKIPYIFRHNNNVIKITDDKGNSLEEYSGPNKDFFGIKLTPKDLDCKHILISYNTGEEKLFLEDEVITGV